jgi:cAMP-dependent protein kinase regulator
VSAEAYGAFNVRKAYEPIVVPKDDAQKERLRSILNKCWMFKELNEANLSIIIDALSEKDAAPGETLVTQGDAGECMWIIEEGVL